MTDKAMKVVGKRVPRVDAGERVTGRAIYTADLTRPGLACGKIKRSPHAHARIVSIDTSKAEKLKGVLAIVTAADFPVVEPGTIIPFGETGADAWGVGRYRDCSRQGIVARASRRCRGRD